MDFKGRQKELAVLRQFNHSRKVHLAVLYGRRRVGKTALIEKAFEDQLLLKFEGLEGLSTRKQLGNFYFTLYQYTQDPRHRSAPPEATWQEAFLELEKTLAQRPCVVFFDEFQWMASMRGELVSIFKWAWDNYFSKHPQSHFILCGSVSSFIVRQVVKSRALYGRVNLEMHLEPFSLQETWTYFDGKRSKAEVLEIQLALGGIPQYLQGLNPQLSLLQNLEKMAFSSSGYFFREYQRLFISHFSKNSHYELILRALAQRGPLSTETLAGSLKIPKGGSLSHLLEDLALAGFIEKYTPIDKPERSRLILYRIEDEFLNFYFRFIEKNRNAIQSGTLRAYELLGGPGFQQWKGYAFEELCRKNQGLIARVLGFSGIRYRSGSWFRKVDDRKAQIDLLFDRADHVVTVCEMKAGNSLDVSDILESFKRRAELIEKVFSSRIQKVLILAMPMSVPDRIRQNVDEILTADEIFFQ